ncbi:tetratricopeptide repeat protein [uncultured Roseicyclus sp.]|jgi:tetratricopeptide (TPR) repeat protein|uniref:tetratricopeptide repeat protein n=1 Tax=uncultured Roseicyclus sp. TaxID=543072 RepID=UPI0026046FD7|nr:tetratricopeptide repeat protein [uncultured Roseicyclus sp.]
MRSIARLHNIALAAALCALSLLACPNVAQAQVPTTADALLDRLATPDLRNWDVVEDEIMMVWSRSGSAAGDYLLERGRAALADGDLQAAHDHLTALTDHVPDFAEGWNARATLFFELDRYGPAIADIQRVLALEPRHFGALTGLGFIFEEMGDLDGALAAFRAAQAIHPHREEINASVARVSRALEGAAL